jgi:3-oxoadipate enol-lactonase
MATPSRIVAHVYGSGKPLVLIHGFPLNSCIWRSQIDALCQSHRVIVVDLPGFGASKLAGPFTMASVAAELHAMLVENGALPCVLGGLSMGGYIAQAFAREFGRDLRGLLLANTRAAAETPEGKKGREAMRQALREKGVGAVAEMMMPRLVGPQASPELRAELDAMMRSCPADAIDNAIVAIRDREDMIEFLPTLSLPALVIVGDADAITPPELAQMLAARIPDSALAIIPGAGHMSIMEQPDRVNFAMKDWLRRINW